MITDQKTTDLSRAPEGEVSALHCLGMCSDWAGHPACDGEPGLQKFLTDCADGLRWQRDEIVRLRAEVASLRLTLGGRTFSGQPVPDPIGCPLPGACAQVAEIKRLRRSWLRVIQQENQCPATGGGCLSKRCGCVEEMEVLANAG
jgi:hypothetical protein